MIADLKLKCCFVGRVNIGKAVYTRCNITGWTQKHESKIKRMKELNGRQESGNQEGKYRKQKRRYSQKIIQMGNRQADMKRNGHKCLLHDL